MKTFSCKLLVHCFNPKQHDELPNNMHAGKEKTIMLKSFQFLEVNDYPQWPLLSELNSTKIQE